MQNSQEKLHESVHTLQANRIKWYRVLIAVTEETLNCRKIIVTRYRLEESVIERKARLETMWGVCPFYNWLFLLIFSYVQRWHSVSKRRKLLEEVCLPFSAPQWTDRACHSPGPAWSATSPLPASHPYKAATPLFYLNVGLERYKPLGQEIRVPTVTHSLWPWGSHFPSWCHPGFLWGKRKGNGEKSFRSFSSNSLDGAGAAVQSHVTVPEPQFAELQTQLSLLQENLLYININELHSPFPGPIS